LATMLSIFSALTTKFLGRRQTQQSLHDDERVQVLEVENS